MLDVQDAEHLAAVRAFAERTGQRDELERQLRYLDEYACRTGDDRVDRTLTRCVLRRDHAPYSFEFVMLRKDISTSEYVYFFTGGLLYHGAHDGHGSGAAPTFAATLVATSGWSVHT